MPHDSKLHFVFYYICNMKMWLKIAALLLLATVIRPGDGSHGQNPERIPIRITAATFSAHDTQTPALENTPLAATVTTNAGGRLSTSEVPVSKPRAAGSETFLSERYGKQHPNCTPGIRQLGTRPVPNYSRPADRYVYGLRKIII